MSASSPRLSGVGSFGRLGPSRPSLSFAIFAALVACMSWHQVPGDPAALLAQYPERVRINRADGGSVQLYYPLIVHDSITGLLDESDSSSRAAVPLAAATSVEVWRFSPGRTAVLVAAGATVLLVALGQNSGGGNTNPAPSGGGSGCKEGPCGGSCPYVYSWDGAGWRLGSGTFGGAIARTFQRTVVDPLDFAVPQDGALRLKVTNELEETDYVDALAVLAVDHEPGLAVAADPSGGLHTLAALVAPVRAEDYRGADALARVRDLDGWGWESSFGGRDTSNVADLRDGLELTFLRPHRASKAHLVLDARNTVWAVHLIDSFLASHGAATGIWYDSLNTQPALAQALAMRLAAEGFLALSVRTRSGWTPAGLFWLVGPEHAARQVLDVDLTQVEGDTVQLRLESAPALWLVDRVAMDFSADRPLVVHELPLVTARSSTGTDVASLLASTDGRYYVMEHGDSAELAFRVTAPAPGTERSLLLRSTGWYWTHVPSADPPDIAMQNAVMKDPLGISRMTLIRLNEALARLSPPVAAGQPRQ